MKMLNIFKRNETERGELENIKMIAVPDIREYMVQGYKEIEQVRQEKEREEKAKNNYKKDAEKFEKLYDATLVALDEFKKRDDTNSKKIEDLKEKLETEQTIRKADSKESKEEINKLQEEIIILNNKNEKIEDITRKKIKTELADKIKEIKGNLSKDKVIEIINSI